MGSGYDPLELSRIVERKVTRESLEGQLRRYYRFRHSHFYGGIYTADAVGCNLRCVFCWSYRYVTDLDAGEFYSPREVADRLVRGARRYGLNRVRISGAEPTIGREHLTSLLRHLEGSGIHFILETNAILLSDESYAREISRDHVHVRVSLKGTSPEVFHRITGAREEGFFLQLKGLENLVEADADVHVSAVISFSPKEELTSLLQRIREIDPSLVASFEPEIVILYDKVKRRLKKVGINPEIAMTIDGKLVTREDYASSEI